MPKARRVLAPSTVISADSCEPRKEACDEPAEALAAGVSSRKSCQRRPLAGRAWSCVAVTVVATAGATGSGGCAAATLGATGDGFNNAACTRLGRQRAGGESGAAPDLSGNTFGGATASASSMGADWVSSAGRCGTGGRRIAG